MNYIVSFILTSDGLPLNEFAPMFFTVILNKILIWSWEKQRNLNDLKSGSRPKSANFVKMESVKQMYHEFKKSVYGVYGRCKRKELAPKQLPKRRNRKLNWEDLLRHFQKCLDAFHDPEVEHLGTGFLKGDIIKTSTSEYFQNSQRTRTESHFHCRSCVFLNTPMWSNSVMD